MTMQIDVPGHSRLLDMMPEGYDTLFCECGALVVPECSVSALSIVQAWDAHRSEIAPEAFGWRHE